MAEGNLAFDPLKTHISFISLIKNALYIHKNKRKSSARIKKKFETR